ncbi:MAG: aminopeptidase P N-terminal domain-containing protein [Gemmatimonadaceae bacterium]
MRVSSYQSYRSQFFSSIAGATIPIVLLAQVLGAQIPQSEYAERRAALAKLLGNGIVLAIGSPEPEEDYIAFYQNSPFVYLTGFREPDADLVFEVKDGQIVGTPQLFVQPSDPAEEVWTGKRVGVDGVQRELGFEGRPQQTLLKVLDSLLTNDNTTLNVIGNYQPGRAILSPEDQQLSELMRRHPNATARSVNARVNELRRVKSPAELDLIRKAVAITVDAEREAMRYIEPGQNEFETQALIEYTFRRNGADRPSFSSIVGSGPNSTTLHYNDDDRFFNANDMMVMDIGASYRGYSADVTRTVPVSGKFSASQRAIYQTVRDVQAAGERQAKLNAPGRMMADSANAAMNIGLAKLGLIESPGATYDCDTSASRQCSQTFLYYMHGLGHGIGLDVHDPGAAGAGFGGSTLVPGSAFTIEPGIYVRGNLLDIIPVTARNKEMIEHIRPAVERFKNIGVRIEDDYIMTDKGLEWVSKAPREINEIEALMREPWTGPSPRDKSKIDWYRER